MANGYGFMQETSPFNLDVIRVLSGISNSERIPAESRNLADRNLLSLLRMMKAEIDSESNKESEIIQS